MARIGRRTATFLMFFLWTLCTSSLHGQTQDSNDYERVLIETSKPYDRVVAAIRSGGGRVTHQFKYVDAIGAEIPIKSLEAIRALVGSSNMYKDVNVPAPASVLPTNERLVSGRQIGPVITSPTLENRALTPASIPAYATSHPDLYSLNNAGTRVESLHAKQFTGNGVIVAVIDSGIRPGFPVLESDGSVIGGEDFVGDGLGYSNIKNDGHGTFIASLISGNAEFQLNGSLLAAVQRYAPNALDPATGRLPLIGAAPAASIYAIRVFGTNATAGTPLTVIMSAIQRVIDLRLDYDRGVVGGVNIQVANLSFAVSTLKAGRTLLDQSVDAMLSAGIVPIVSAGNAGISSLTIGSPGSSMSAVTVGAASFAPNERIGGEVEFGLDHGIELRPFAGTQTAWFSSRGPNADGRVDPDVMTSGMVNFAQGYCKNPNQGCPGEVSLASGTSFSAPIAAGIAAVLRQAAPGATATEIRNAIVGTGRPGLFEDGSIDLDRGEGMIDALGAYNRLAKGCSCAVLPTATRPDEDVRVNVERNTRLRVKSGTFTQTLSNLKPGQRADILYDVLPGTTQVIVTINGISPTLPPSAQNVIYGDGLYFAVHSAKTSAHNEGDYLATGFPRSPDFVMINDPDTGLMRITVTGDWVNAGTVSASVTVASVIEPLPGVTISGSISDRQTITVPFTIPSGVEVAEFLLSWKKEWSHYPTSDVDLILINPIGKVITTGVSLAGPERVTIASPRRGDWLMLIDGFNIPAGSDDFKLRVLLDGQLAN